MQKRLVRRLHRLSRRNASGSSAQSADCFICVSSVLICGLSDMSKGVLLVNLGSPDSPSVPDVRRYLKEFLMDERVLDVNWLMRFCVVHFTILPRRPPESARAYQSIW